MTRRWSPPLAVTIVAIALLTACSGGGKAAPTTTLPAVAKSVVVTKGNAICTATEASLQKAEKATSGSPNSDAIVAFVATKLVPATRAEVSKIRAIGRPIGDHGELASILDSMDQTLDAIIANPGQAIVSTNPFAGVDQRLRAYGLTACAT